jgi:hypothetical protein
MFCWAYKSAGLGKQLGKCSKVKQKFEKAEKEKKEEDRLKDQHQSDT